MSKLTAKQRLFIDAYLETWNATEAARRAGYRGNDATLAQVGYQNMRKVYISQVIEQRLAESAMTAGEALSRLGAIARGNMGDYIGENGAVDWSAVKRDGHLFKAVSGQGEKASFKMHDSQAALVQILKMHGAYTKKIEHTGKDGAFLMPKQIDVIIEHGNYSQDEIRRSTLALVDALKTTDFDKEDIQRQAEEIARSLEPSTGELSIIENE